MKYIKKFENLIDNDKYKNKIFIIDSSASFINELTKYINSNINFYLTEEFTAILVDSVNLDIYENITLPELIRKIRKLEGGFGDGIQDAIDYIESTKMEGNILIFSDGWFHLNVSKIKNYVSVLTTDESKPVITGDCAVFYKDLESLDQFYPPRDDNDIERYKLKKSAKKYNL